MKTLKKFLLSKIKEQQSYKENPKDKKQIKFIYDRLIKTISTIDANKQYLIIGYGSLLNKRSRSRTILNAINEYPVKIKNYKRVFNLIAGDNTVLNIEKDKNLWFNAVGILMDYKDMLEVMIREMQYDIIEIPVKDILIYDKKLPSLKNISVFVVVCSDKNNLSKKEPLLKYVQANIFGCKQISDEFLQDYLKTTYCYKNNKLISLSKWIKQVDLIKHFRKCDSDY